MPRRHRTVMRKIVDCRTKALGGEAYFCETCKDYRFSYHSCKDRHCPKCGYDENSEWCRKMCALLLPVPYFLVTFTVPNTLHPVAHHYPKIFYNAMFHASAGAMQLLAHDPKYIGGQLGFISVLQTWKRDLGFHPHLHIIVPGGGLSEDGTEWHPARKNFFLPEFPLADIFAAKLRDELAKEPDVFAQIPPTIWEEIKKKKKKRQKRWVVDVTSVGGGEHAIQYLSRYVFRVALSNKSLQRIQNGNVTFEYQENETKQYRTRTVPAEEFIWLFLQHVLPRGLCKVRHNGYLASRNRSRLEKVKELLKAASLKNESVNMEPLKTESVQNESTPENNGERKKDTPAHRILYCPKCKSAMQWDHSLERGRIRAP
jgi:hypothetical protein